MVCDCSAVIPDDGTVDAEPKLHPSGTPVLLGSGLLRPTPSTFRRGGAPRTAVTPGAATRLAFTCVLRFNNSPPPGTSWGGDQSQSPSCPDHYHPAANRRASANAP